MTTSIHKAEKVPWVVYVCARVAYELYAFKFILCYISNKIIDWLNTISVSMACRKYHALGLNSRMYMQSSFESN